MSWLRSAAFAAAVATASGTDQPFVPVCIAKQCSQEAVALGRDAYVHTAATCVATNFGPCGQEAWDCLGDAACRSVLTCAPKVLETCQADIWKLLTDPTEREKFMCIAGCMKDGKVEPFCVAAKCSKASIECLVDRTCLDTVLCLPKALGACSGPAVKCLLGRDDECRKNLKCLNHGVEACGADGLNLLTDSKIADFIDCAGAKCPHPGGPVEAAQAVLLPVAAGSAVVGEPSNAAEQLLCIAEHCSGKVLGLLKDQDVKGLLTCARLADLQPAWDCLGDVGCAAALKCWGAPAETCAGDVWKVLVEDTQRKRIETAVRCLRGCAAQHKDNFVEAALCSMSQCGQGLLDCTKDDVCKEAFKCLPEMAGECALGTLDAYLHNPKFQNATNSLAITLEKCGRGAVEMLRDHAISDALRCTSQCTRTPKAEQQLVVV